MASQERSVTYAFPHSWDATRYPPSYLRVGFSEAEVQRGVLDVLLALKCVAFPVDVGARFLMGRAFGALKRAGASPDVLFGKSGAGVRGLSDIVGVTPRGRALFVEVKAPSWMVPSEKRKGKYVQRRPAGEPSDEQLEFLDAVHRSNAIAGVVWSAADVKDLYKHQEMDHA